MLLTSCPLYHPTDCGTTQTGIAPSDAASTEKGRAARVTVPKERACPPSPPLYVMFVENLGWIRWEPERPLEPAASPRPRNVGRSREVPATATA